MTVELPFEEGVKLHRADAEAWANKPMGRVTQIELHASHQEEAINSQASPWQLAGGGGVELVANPFDQLPPPPRTRGRPAANSNAGAAGASEGTTSLLDGA